MAVAIGTDVRTVPTTRGPVRVRDTGGDGRPMLLVHSLLVDGGLYDRLWPLLVGRGFRCVVPDVPLGAHAEPMIPGADLSPRGLADLLAEVLDALGLDRVAVVGVDTGGALTQLLMAYHRGRVGRVVLTACDAYEAFPPASLKVLLAPLRTAAGSWLIAQTARWPLARRLGVCRPLTHAGVPDVLIARWSAPLRDPSIRRDLRAVVRGMSGAVTMAAAEANRDFPEPVLIAWGDDDRVFPRRLGERLAGDLPHATLVDVPDCAAFAALDQPELLAETDRAGPYRLVVRRISVVGLRRPALSVRVDTTAVWRRAHHTTRCHASIWITGIPAANLRRRSLGRGDVLGGRSRVAGSRRHNPPRSASSRRKRGIRPAPKS
jgi:pimeloyl-ACP methyl ester carboxylesterase